MAEVAVWESVTVAGRAERARVARTFVGAVLGPGHSCRDDAVLPLSELFGDSVRHSGCSVPEKRSRLRSWPGTALSGWRSPTEADRAARAGPR